MNKFLVFIITILFAQHTYALPAVQTYDEDPLEESTINNVDANQKETKVIDFSRKSFRKKVVTITGIDGGGDYECNGTNDQIEINKALDEVASNTDLTTVYLQESTTCVIDEPVIISSNTIFAGDATATIKLKEKAAWWTHAKPLVGQKDRVSWDYWGDVNDSISNVEIYGFTIDAGLQEEPAGDTYLPLIAFYNPSNISIHDMNLKNSQWDIIRLTSPTRGFVTDTKVYSNKIQNSGHEGICFISLTDFEIYKNQIYSTRTNTGILAKSSNRFSIYENIIGNSLAKNPSGYAGILLTNEHAPINQAEIYKNMIYGKNGGIHLSGEGASYDKDTRKGVHIHHNRIYKTTTATTSDGYVMDGGIKINGYNNTIIENNIIDASSTDAIVYEGESGGESGYETIVRNNIIINSERYGINNKKPTLHTFISSNNLLYNNAEGNYNQTTSEDDIYTNPLFADTNGTLNKWYHIVASYDNASETLKIFINAKERASRKIPGFGTIGTNSKYTYLGGYRGIAHWFEGKEDDLLLWNRALSANEINELYHNGNPTDVEGSITNGLQAYLKMENNWEDSSANGFSGIDSTASFTTNAISGDYASKYLENYTVLPYILSTTNGFTISVWVNRSNITDGYQTIFNKGSQGNNNHIWVYFKNELVRFEIGNGNDRHEIEAYLLDPNEIDYHLQSEYGHWNGMQWVLDSQSSPCIDAGYVGSSYINEPTPNGGRINIGVYGNTSEASKSNTHLAHGQNLLIPILMFILF